MRVRWSGAVWAVVLAFWASPDPVLAGTGAELASKAEALETEERLLAAKDKELFQSFAEDCLEKGVGPPVLDVLTFLEALDPYNPDWGAMRARARSLGPPDRSYLAWGRAMFKRNARKCLKPWKDLLDKILEAGLPSTARRVSAILVALSPDEKEARQALGHVKVKRRWMSAFDARLAEEGFVRDPLWGYIRPEDRDRLEKGERPRGEEWVSAEVEEETPRSWGEKALFRGARLELRSNEAFDASLSLHKALHEFLERFDREFGDFIPAPGGGEPVRVFLTRTREGMEALMKERGRVPEPMPVIAVHSSSGDLFIRSDGAPWTSNDEATLQDHLMEGLVHLAWTQARPKGGGPASSNGWIILGLRALALNRALFEARNLRPGGCFKAYADGRREGALPRLEALLELQEGAGARETVQARSAALCLFLLQYDRGRYATRFCGVARDVLDGVSDSKTLSRALELRPDEIEKWLESYMAETLAD